MPPAGFRCARQSTPADDRRIRRQLHRRVQINKALEMHPRRHFWQRASKRCACRAGAICFSHSQGATSARKAPANSASEGGRVKNSAASMAKALANFRQFDRTFLSQRPVRRKNDLMRRHRLGETGERYGAIFGQRGKKRIELRPVGMVRHIAGIDWRQVRLHPAVAVGPRLV
jgi:hypothetical protein